MCLFVTCLFLQVPGLLSAAAGAALQMQDAAAAASAGGGDGGNGATVLPQVPLVTQLLQLYRNVWPPLCRLLCEQQQQGGTAKPPAVLRASAGLVLLGNIGLLMRQLLTKSAAAADSRQQQQQQQHLTSAVLYCANVLGDQVSCLWADMLAASVQRPVDGSGSLAGLYRRLEPSCTAVPTARAVQVFEAAVRHLLRTAPAAAAAGSTVAPSSSSRGGGSEGGSNLANFPPTVDHIALAAAGTYIFLMTWVYESSSSSSSGSSTGELSCSQQQLLQALLSMLLTNAKLWQAGIVQPLPMEMIGDIAQAAGSYRQLATVAAAGILPGQIAACHLNTGNAAAAAAVVDGQVQVTHFIARYFSWLEQQLRQWVQSGDTVAAANWFMAPANESLMSKTPLQAPGGASAAAAQSQHHSRLEELLTLLVPSCRVAASAAGSQLRGLEFESGRDQVARLYPSLRALLSVTCSKAQHGNHTTAGRTTPAQLVQLPGGEVAAGNPTIAAATQTLLQQSDEYLKDATLGCVLALAQMLQGFVDALTGAVPSRFGCNSPRCLRLEGVSEGYGLVRGKACVCGGCGMAR
jgi:hypothetical protein